MKHLLFTLAMLLFAACQEELQPNILTSDELEGNWQQQMGDSQAFSGATYALQFSQDSFSLKLNRFTDVVVPESNCPGNRVEYITGTYTLTDDRRIRLSGTYSAITDALENQEAVCPELLGTAYQFEARYYYNGMNLLRFTYDFYDNEREITLRRQ